MLNYTLVYKVLLLGLIFVAGLFIRIYYIDNTPLKNKHNYSTNYEPVLYHMLGHGMNRSDASASDNHAKLWKFLNAEVDSLDINIVKKVVSENPNIKYFKAGQQYQTFAYYIASYVWKIFGISWSSLFYFYAVFSMFAGLALFFVSQKMTQSYWGGIFTFVTYALAMPEIIGSTWSIRDVSPVWFLAFSLYYLFVVLNKFKNTKLNYFSYFIFGIVLTVGIGWRADVLMFTPFILVYLVINFVIQYKNKLISIYKILILLSLLLLGSYFTLKVNSLVSSKNAPPLGFMHIAHYAEHTRSKIGQYENSFQNQFCDSMTKNQVETYQQQTYPNKKVIYMHGDYGTYALELYLKTFAYNFYRWVDVYPKYIIEDFILQDLMSGMYISDQSVLRSIWEKVVATSLIGSIILLIIGINRKEITFLLSFIFYYSLIYWAILPMSKHIMIVSIPISLLSGLVLYFILYFIISKSYRVKVVDSIKIKKILNAFYIFFILMFLYILLLGVSYYVSVKSKENFIKDIKKLEKNGIDITNKIDKNSNLLYLDLSKYKQIGIMVKFKYDRESLLYITDEYLDTHNGQTHPYTNAYKINDSSMKHTLFTVCTQINHTNIVFIELPNGVEISKVSLIPLKHYSGIWFTTVYEKTATAGSQKLYGGVSTTNIPIKKTILEKYNLSIDDFIASSYGDKGNENLILNNENNSSSLWFSTTKDDHLWSKLRSINIVEEKGYKEFLSVVFNKEALELSEPLKVKLDFYDKNNNFVYSTMLTKIIQKIRYEPKQDKHMFTFNLIDIPKSAKIYRFYIGANKRGKYSVPNDYYIEHIKIKLNKIKL
jgi:hypothetical protein